MGGRVRWAREQQFEQRESEGEGGIPEQVYRLIYRLFDGRSAEALKMNLALIHDRLHIKTFWEKRIDNDCQYAQNEEERVKKSALKKLRGEWTVRLENRTKHLKSLNDNYVRKVKKSADQT